MLDGFGAGLSRVSDASPTFCILHLPSFLLFNTSDLILLLLSTAIFLTVHLFVCVLQGPPGPRGAQVKQKASNQCSPVLRDFKLKNHLELQFPFGFSLKDEPTGNLIYSPTREELFVSVLHCPAG